LQKRHVKKRHFSECLFFITKELSHTGKGQIFFFTSPGSQSIYKGTDCVLDHGFTHSIAK
jgi:hypothetical protein